MTDALEAWTDPHVRRLRVLAEQLRGLVGPVVRPRALISLAGSHSRFETARTALLAMMDHASEMASRVASRQPDSVLLSRAFLSEEDGIAFISGVPLPQATELLDERSLAHVCKPCPVGMVPALLAEKERRCVLFFRLADGSFLVAPKP